MYEEMAGEKSRYQYALLKEKTKGCGKAQTRSLEALVTCAPLTENPYYVPIPDPTRLA